MLSEQIKSMAREMMQPVLDELVDMSSMLYIKMMDNLPSDMPEEQKLDVVKQVFKSQADILSTSLKGVVPTDFEAKLKEAVIGK